MDARTQLKQLLKSRDALVLAPEIAKIASNNRTSNIAHLTNEEAEMIFAKWLEHSPQYLIEGIYCLCYSMGIIFTEEQCLTNDTLILTYYKHHFPLYAALIDKERLAELPYLRLLNISDGLKDIYLLRANAMN